MTYFQQLEKNTSYDDLIKLLLDIFKMDRFGNAVVTEGELLYRGYQLLKKLPTHVEEEILFKRFYRNQKSRYSELIEPQMVSLKPLPFAMGTKSDSKYVYCGEQPDHIVQLSPYSISKVVVSQELFHEYNFKYVIDNKLFPAVNVTWYDAFMFAVWCGAELPTEAQWEYAVRSSEEDIFFCTEENLPEYAWFSENSKGSIQESAKLMSNPFGLYDMLGNVWEWCGDSYDSEYYKHSAFMNPINLKESSNKVCRGGSFHSFVDMCRNSFRHHEPASFYAYDIGFRLSKS